MRKWLAIISILSICGLLAGASACGGSENNAQSQLPVAEVVREDFTVEVTGSGNLEASREARLTFGSSGTVAMVNVTEGDHVTSGQALASLDTTFLEQTLANARQDREAAEQAVRSAEQSVTAAQLTVEATEGSVTAAELQVLNGELAIQNAEIDLEAARNSYYQLTTPYPFTTFAFTLPDALADVRDAWLFLQEAQAELAKAAAGEPYSLSEALNDLTTTETSLTAAESKLSYGLGEGTQPSGVDYWTLRSAQLTIDKAEIARDVAVNNLVTLENSLALAENTRDNALNSLDIAVTGLASKQTALSRAQTALEMAEDDLEKATITAPFDGVIAAVNVEAGDKLAAPTVSPQTIIHLVDPGLMELVVELDEIDIPWVRVNQKALIEVDALPDTVFEGKVTAIYPLPRTVGGVVLYNARVSFPVTEDSGLKAGMSASADIILAERNDTLLVPSRAVYADAQGNTVVQVVAGGQTVEKPVVIGISDGNQTEILQGLQEGETVVIQLRSTIQLSSMFGLE